MKNSIGEVLNSKDGVSLIEILLSIIVLSIIVIPLLSLFVASSLSNYASGNLLDATYVAQNTLETVYSLSESTNEIDVAITSLIEDGGFEESNVSANDYELTKEMNGWFTVLKIQGSAFDEEYLYKVIVKVYEDNSLEKLEVKMETILNWEE